MCRRTVLQTMSRKTEDSINNQNAVSDEVLTKKIEENELPLGEEAQPGTWVQLGGFLVHRVSRRNKTSINRRPDLITANRIVYKGPFCQDFVKFCLERFEVGIWSSAKDCETLMKPWLVPSVEIKKQTVVRADTAIFPLPHKAENANDTTLGPGGDLWQYLEGLEDADYVPPYVRCNPFGQPAITLSRPDWSFYSKIILHFQNEEPPITTSE